ncbi:hypothetical protein C8Q80DRAFT_25590 [Daedaleopsis nitida]|nr:hypothetical protein C8Q80DRAFT_25590 [Daedaleopsis nitida]
MEDGIRSLTGSLLVLLFLCRYASAFFFIVPATQVLRQCSQVELQWTDAPPIQLWVAPDRQIAPGDPTLETLGPIDSNALNWTVDLPVGQSISFTYIRLANQYDLLVSDTEYTVIAGENADCLPAGVPTSITPTAPLETPSMSASPPGVPSLSISKSSTSPLVPVLATVGAVVLLIAVTLLVFFVKRRRAASNRARRAAAIEDPEKRTEEGAPLAQAESTARTEQGRELLPTILEDDAVSTNGEQSLQETSAQVPHSEEGVQTGLTATDGIAEEAR